MLTYDNLTIDEILLKRVGNQRHNPLNRKSLQTLKDKKNLVGAEIGVSAGDNAFDMCVKLHINTLYLIDPYVGFAQWSQGKLDEHLRIAKSLLNNFRYKTIWLIDKSDKAVDAIDDDELDFVYIDGDHSKEGTFSDLELYWPKVKSGGLFCGDNLEFGPVAQALKKFAEKHKQHFETDSNIDCKTIDWWTIKP